MTCDQIHPLLSAHLDGETAPAERTPLEAHLAGCPACRALLDEMRADDADLRGAFSERRATAAAVAERALRELGLAVVAAAAPPPTESPAKARDHGPMNGAADRIAIVRSALTAPATGDSRIPEASVIPRAKPQAAPVTDGRPRRPWRLSRVLTPLLAAAAGFALAALIFRPGTPPATKPPVAQTQPAPVARLALATGQVEICPPGAPGFFVCPTGADIAPDTVVRTGPNVRCELKMVDGSEVRLNDATELTVRAPRQVELASGQVFSAVAKTSAKDQFVVRAAPAAVALVALGTEFDVSCAPGDKRATLTVVEGSVRVDGATSDTPGDVVKAGEAVTLAGGTARDRRQVASLVTATQWVDEILVMKGRDNPELARRLDDLLARLGGEKMEFLAAQEVRRLGDHCVVPLSRFIQSPRSQAGGALAEHRRREASRIIADVATTQSVPELINLLADADGEVRYNAARALQRLTGQTQNFRPEQWRDQALFTCQPSIERWHTWWASNKTKLPGCDPDAVKPLK